MPGVAMLSAVILPEETPLEYDETEHGNGRADYIVLTDQAKIEGGDWDLGTVERSKKRMPGVSKLSAVILPREMPLDFHETNHGSASTPQEANIYIYIICESIYGEHAVSEWYDPSRCNFFSQKKTLKLSVINWFQEVMMVQ